MAKVLVLYYSMYGHIETMARAVAEVQAKWMAQKLSLSVYRKPCRRNYLKKQAVKRKLHRLQPRKNWPITTPLFLVHLPALVTCPVKCVPSSTRRAACGLPAHYTENWRASLVPIGTGGGQEQTITSTWTTLAHHGMVIVPIGYAAQELFDVSQVRGGTPYGATTIAGGDGSRQPSQEELSIARYQGEYVAGLAVKLNG